MKVKTKQNSGAKLRYKNDAGITLVSLLITVIIITLMAGVAIANITDNDGILKVSSGVRDEYLRVQYQEQLDSMTESIILKNQITGRATTLEEMLDELEEEDWVEQVITDEDSKSVIVQTTDGSVYQIYYDEEQGQKYVEYVRRRKYRDKCRRDSCKFAKSRSRI